MNAATAGSLPLVGLGLVATNRATKTRSKGYSRLEQMQILSAAHMAGFEVITHGRF
jgi:hypothetical protein